MDAKDESSLKFDEGESWIGLRFECCSRRYGRSFR